MDYLTSVFQLVLSMLYAVVADNVFGAILWIFILAMTIFLFLSIWRGVWR